MEESIRQFPKQLLFVPNIVGAVGSRSKIILAGLGGSHLAGDILQCWKPELDLRIHSDYGLPQRADDALVIASSFSGNIAETLSACEEAYTRGLPVAAITSGGKLLEYAKEKGIPHVILPKPDRLQPRMSIGTSLIALLKLIGDEEGIRELGKITYMLNADRLQDIGRVFSVEMRGRIPMVYASSRNKAVAQIWKIMMNENAKSPAAWNIFPELNHNEMEGFDGSPTTDELRARVRVVFVVDEDDDSRIRARMSTTEQVLASKEVAISKFELQGSSHIEKILFGVLVGAWASFHVAGLYKVDAEEVPMVESFKKMLKG